MPRHFTLWGSALLLLAGAPSAVAGEELEAEFFRSRVTTYFQDGRGFQSQAIPDAEGRGNERAWIVQPSFDLQMRQGDAIQHRVALSVDVVSAASPDALDAVSSASRENEAVTLTWQTGVQVDDTTIQLSAMGHAEEYFWSAGAGAGFVHSMADDNTTIQGSLDFAFDSFDPIQPRGFDPGNANRFTLAASLGMTQLLSPTTQASASYTLTRQTGTLETTWNSIALGSELRLGDRFPDQRLRHAWTAALQQALPESDTYLGLQYRFYYDDFEIAAHTVEATATQYVGDFWLRGRYRFHTQTEPFFWVRPGDPIINNLRTADSDLETLDAHEVGLGVRWFYDRSGAITNTSSFFEVGYTSYFRSNSLIAHVLGAEWGKEL